jgi:hypothetical protein
MTTTPRTRHLKIGFLLAAAVLLAAVIAPSRARAGSVALAAGGTDGSGVLSSAETFDSKSSTFTATGDMSDARFLTTATTSRTKGSL